MLLIRVGGDEFVLITDLADKLEAEKTAQKVLKLNGGIVKSGDKSSTSQSTIDSFMF